MGRSIDQIKQQQQAQQPKKYTRTMDRSTRLDDRTIDQEMKTQQPNNK
jgi:hypothetical protein